MTNEQTNARFRRATRANDARPNAGAGAGDAVLIGDAGAVGALLKRRERARRKLTARPPLHIPAAVRYCYFIVSGRGDAARVSAPTHAGISRGRDADAAEFRRRERADAALERRAAAAVRNPALIIDDGRADADAAARRLNTERVLWLIQHAHGRHKKWLYSAFVRARRAEADARITSYSLTATMTTGDARADAPNTERTRVKR